MLELLRHLILGIKKLEKKGENSSQGCTGLYSDESQLSYEILAIISKSKVVYFTMINQSSN